ncbi:hypothetical protein FIA58_011630 [Flavobacterium jejuense]|uniref:Thiopeptide-type bacteriocin biosynthesis domain-containing protein n=1 Tax=Flavobacterium jejuense TaxID=1544455 RepID=A0ABX0IR75_9FLAO|nr:thiopeptide-type bacteriocin biosynthesis protein [Flavobacterium jejuense]NHN26330.1 hypothetical protein [Flavobacterium jejuense]
MKRTFSLGSEWLYYKIYCGVKTADFILTDNLKEKIEFLIENQLISKWFFIRYNDPDSHIRLRFKISTPENLGLVIQHIQEILTPLQEENLIWKIQTDTYAREIERYGATTYEISESIFQADSELILDYISLKPHFENETTSILFSFLAVDQFLNLFLLSKEEKMKLLDRWQSSFKTEFQADKNLKKEFDKNYRNIEKELDALLSFQKTDTLAPIYDVILLKNEKIKDYIPEIKTHLEIDLSSFLSSHVHMMLNRQFTSRQREYELLIYDHLYRYYKRCLFMKKKE